MQEVRPGPFEGGGCRKWYWGDEPRLVLGVRLDRGWWVLWMGRGMDGGVEVRGRIQWLADWSGSSSSCSFESPRVTTKPCFVYGLPGGNVPSALL